MIKRGRNARRILALLAAAALLLTACGTGAGKGEELHMPADGITSETLYVKKADLPRGFILGMDVSSVLAEERSGVKYYDFDGTERDLFAILAYYGVNTIRVRVWNDPYDENGNGYGGGNCDVDAACEIGRRAAENGLKLLVDFHYSDFWADPGKQHAPKAWQGMSIEEKADAAYAFTKDALTRIAAAGADIGMVSLGNETNGALAGETIWANILAIMKAGSKAVREVCPGALVAVHFADPQNAESYATYAKKLDYYSLDYDVLASSYYPYWHGTLDNLAAVLSDIAESYGKKVMVMETSYAFTPEDTDFSGNTIGEGSAVVKDYPYTVQGQANALRDVIDTVATRTKNGIGVVYWEGAWITVGTDSWEENHEKWEKDGSGWATSFSGGYDSDAAKYYGGSAVDNQAFFDAGGHAVESLKVFALVRTGNELPLVPDALEDARVRFDLAADIVLPDTVDAVMSDNSRSPVPVSWNFDAALEERMHAEPGVYEVSGTAEGQTVRCFVTTEKMNLLQNGSFEDGLEPWVLTDRGGADELGVEHNALNSLDGECNLHFWSAKSGTVDFDAAQTVTGLAPGQYDYKVSIQGGDGGDTGIFAWVKIDGSIVATAPLAITSYNNWSTAEIKGITLAAGQTLTVGVSVKCAGEGNGAWGMIDAAALNSAG